MQRNNPLNTTLVPNDPCKSALTALISEIASKKLSCETAGGVANILGKMRREAILCETPITEPYKLFLVTAGNLTMLAREFAEESRFDMSLADGRSFNDMTRLAEDCLILLK